MFALHPKVTVLDHAYVRIFADPARDFLCTPTPETLEAFARTAADMALDERRAGLRGVTMRTIPNPSIARRVAGQIVQSAVGRRLRRPTAGLPCGAA